MSLQRILASIYFLASVAPATATRLAIIPSPETQEVSDLLTANLSAKPGVEVVERSAIDALIQERRLHSVGTNATDLAKIGQLLNAEALISLEVSDQTLSTRLIAVGPGLVMDEEVFSWPVQDLPKWTVFLADRFGKASAEVPAGPQTKALVAMLNIRSSTTGPTAQQQEREAEFLIARALNHLPDVFVLERSMLREADWEKQISDQAKAKYWTSSWLLDGTLTSNAGTSTFDARLSPTFGGEPITFQVEANSLSALSQLVAETLAISLKTQTGPASSDWTTEAKQFEEEAEWALQWRQFDQAERAADTSWILGNRTEKVGLLRAKAALAATGSRWPAAFGNSIFSSNRLDPRNLDDMLRAFTAIQQMEPFTRRSDPKEAAKFVVEMNTLLQKASTVLQGYYYSSEERSPEDQESLRWVRQRIRGLLPQIGENALFTLANLTPSEFRNHQGRPSENFINFFATYGLFSSLWSDTPEESAEEFEKALNVIEGLDPKMSAGIREICLTERRPHHPVVVAWDPKDRPRVSAVREALIQKMMTQGDDRALDAVIINLKRYHHFGLPNLNKLVPFEKTQAAMNLFQDTLWGMRERLVQNQVNTGQWENAIRAAESVLSDHEGSALEVSFNQFRKQIFGYLLEKKWKGPVMIYAISRRCTDFTQEERERFLSSIKAFKESDPKGARFLDSFEENLTDGTLGAPVSPKLPAIAKLTPTRVATVDIRAFLPNIEYAKVYKDRFYFLYNNPSWASGVFEWDPISGQEENYTIADSNFIVTHASAFAVDGQHFYFITDEEVSRFDKTTKKLTQSPSTLLEAAFDMWLVKGTIYATAMSGVLAKIDPTTLSVDLLASARRKPPQNLLESNRTCMPDAIFVDAQDNIQFSVDSKFYQWEEKTRNFTATEASLKPGPSVNRELLRRWIGPTRTHTLNTNPRTLLFSGYKTSGFPPSYHLLPQSTTFGSQIVAIAAVDQVVYVSFYDSGYYHLKVIDDETGRDFVVPVDLSEQPGAAMPLNQLAASKDGVVFFGQSQRFLYFSRKDIEAFAAKN